MKRYILPAFVGATTLALTAAQAADLPQLELPAKPLVQEFFSPWYVRIDGGYRMSSVDGGKIFGAPFISSKYQDAPTIGGGVGLKWNWFRSDVTFDYGSQPDYQGFLFAGTPAVSFVEWCPSGSGELVHPWRQFLLLFDIPFVDPDVIDIHRLREHRGRVGVAGPVAADG